MMNERMLGALADQHLRQMHESAAARRRLGGRGTGRGEARALGESLRVRTGWTLVGLGLRLAVRPGPGLTGTPRPAGS